MSEIQLEKQEILIGSSRLTNRKRRSFDRINYMLKIDGNSSDFDVGVVSIFYGAFVKGIYRWN